MSYRARNWPKKFRGFQETHAWGQIHEAVLLYSNNLYPGITPTGQAAECPPCEEGGGGGDWGTLSLAAPTSVVFSVSNHTILLFFNLSYFPPPHKCHFIMMHTPFYPGFLLYFLLPALPVLNVLFQALLCFNLTTDSHCRIYHSFVFNIV